MRFLTLFTFAGFNPDWKINLWQPPKLRDQPKVTWRSGEHKFHRNSLSCYRNKLETIPNLEVKTSEIGMPDLSGVAESDLLRWKLLSEEGGMWSDMDILFMKSIDRISVNKKENKEATAVFCFENSKYCTHSIGLLMASPGVKQFTDINERAIGYLDPANYQSVGATLLNDILPYQDFCLHKGFVNLEFEEFYPYPWNEVITLYQSKQLLDVSRSVGLHWYAGDPASSKACTIVDHMNYSKFNNALSILLNNVLEECPLRIESI